MAQEYKTTMEPIFKQSLPKKCVYTKRISVKKGYDCQASLWIPDTPYSKYPPGIGLTVRHGKDSSKQRVRFVFQTTQELVDFSKEFQNFILEHLEEVLRYHGEAVSEWARCRENVVEFKKRANESGRKT